MLVALWTGATYAMMSLSVGTGALVMSIECLQCEIARAT